MKSTPVKDTGMTLLNLASVQVNRKADAGDFQKIWNNQMNKGTQDSQGTAEKQKIVSEKKTENGQMRQDAYSRVRKEDSVQEEEKGTGEEMTSEELERVMELLGQVSAELMQQIADVFGVTMEEIQAVMSNLDLEQVELLDASQLGELLLQLGGAQDASALVTDETLYDNYRMVMDQLQEIVQSAADELNMEPEELVRFAAEEADSRVGGEIVSVTDENIAGKQQSFNVEGIEETGVSVDTNQNMVTEVQETSAAENQEGRQSGAESRHSDEKSDNGEHVNLLIQNIRAEQFQPGAVQTDSIAQSSPWTAETRDIMNQIMEYMKVQLSPDTTSLEMQLHPASLGTLQVQIASKSGIVTANFITQNESVKAALESQMVQLRESFEEQGVKIEAIEVTVQTHEFERNLEQGRGRSKQEPEKRNRTRRIQLASGAAMEELNEEDTLTAEMMKMDGSTIDYTA